MFTVIKISSKIDISADCFLKIIFYKHQYDSSLIFYNLLNIKNIKKHSW